MNGSKVRLILGVLLAWMFQSSVQSQDFLKKLEEKLKQQVPTAPATPMPENPPAEIRIGEDLPAPKEKQPTNPFLLPEDPFASGVKQNLPSVPPPPSNPNQPVAPNPIPRVEPQATIAVEPESAGPAYLGLIAERIPAANGLLVVEIQQGSPAWKAGFQVGDRILAVSGNAVSDLDQLAIQLQSIPAGKPIKFLIQRAGRNKDLTAVLLDRSIASRTQPSLDGNAVPSGKPVLGLSVANLSDYFRKQFGIVAYRGAAVTDVARGSPADQIGIKPGDCVVEIDGNVIQSAAELQEWLSRARPGQATSISYYRGRGLNQAQVILGGDGGFANANGLDPSMLTPQYVSGLQLELDRVRAQLDETVRRMEELEQRLRVVEAQRPRR